MGPGVTKIMTTRVVPTKPHLDGSQLRPREIAYIHLPYVEETENIKISSGMKKSDPKP